MKLSKLSHPSSPFLSAKASPHFFRHLRCCLIASSLLLLVGAPAPRAHAQAGSLDLSFDPGAGADAVVSNVLLQPDGKILVQGDFVSIGGVTRPGIARLNQDGSVDQSFDTGAGPDFFVNTFDLTPNGQIFVGGDFTLFNGVPSQSLARLNPDGSVDQSFGVEKKHAISGAITALVVQPDGKPIIAGDFTAVDGEKIDRLARLKVDGSLDGQFRRIPQRFGFFVSPVARVVLQPDGKVLIASLFGTVEPFALGGFKVVRVTDRNTVDQTFNPGNGAAGINGVVNSLVLQPDGKIIVGGTFREVGGVPVGGVARLNSDGSLDSTFAPGNGFDQVVNTVALQPDGKVLVGGLFANFNGVARKGTARLNPDGSLDLSYRPVGTNGAVNGIAVQPDGRIVIVGDFTSVGNLPRVRLARLNADGSPEQGVLGTVVTITALRMDVSQTGNEPGILEVKRTGGDLSQPLTVPYAVSGNAIANFNYEPLPGSVTFAPGVDTFLIQVTPINAPISLGVAKVKVALAASPPPSNQPNAPVSYTLGDPNRAKVRINP